MKRSTLTWRRTAVAAVVPLALTGLAACGGDDAETAADSTSSSNESSEQSSSEDEGTEESAEAGSEVSNEEFVDLVSTAFEQATTASFTTSTQMQGQEVTGEGEADFSSNPMAMQMSMQLPTGGETEMILVDQAMYMQMPEAGGKYVKLDLSGAEGDPLGSMLADSMDPSAQADVMEKGLVSATYVGEEDVDGESMDHYSAVVDPAAALEENKALQQLPQSAVPEEMTYDIWFDDEGFYRKLSFDLGEMGGATEMTLDDWGTEVDISAPPADQVTTMGDMMGSMGNGGSQAG